MSTDLNIDEDSEDLWETSNGVFDNFNEQVALKHLSEKAELRTDRYTGFDNNSGDTWIYPTNYPVRKYQHDIVQSALFKNTLVCLPTGLGKTFIAAVVMYNFYRWYPQGKVIFMAPTKPLVSQQIDACFHIMGISKDDTAEITGQQKKENRLKQWKMKRVFYATPQSVVSDIDDPNFPIQSIKLVVIDEAHKARGKYAYCEVIRIIKEKNEMFRVLALSATPGRTTNDVAEVVHNLWISNIEVRTEKCSDVLPYIHKKQIETIVVRLTDKMQKYRDDLINIIDPYVRNLIQLDVIRGSTHSLNKGWLVMQKRKYEQSRIIQTHPNHSEVMANFSCISLYHALELLERHGLWPFVNYLDSTEAKFIVAKDYQLRQLVAAVREDIGSYPFTNGVTNAVIPPDFDFGHPKYDELRKYLSNHLSDARKSQAIIFCEFRDSAFLIHQMLLQMAPNMKPAIFIGQGSSTGQKGITQKQQIATMADFRKGIYNVLIATCVAEEGIDCGEVDLIVCFDVTTKNPTRLVQRMGRTGRKRNGKVCLLVTEGKEQNNLKDSMTAKNYTNKRLATHSDVVDSLCKSPRLLPSEFNPRCVETFIQTGAATQSNEVQKHEVDVTVPSEKRSTVQPPRQRPSTLADLRNFFRPITAEPTAQKIQLNELKKPPIPSPCRSTELRLEITERLKVPTFWEIIEDEKSSGALKSFAIKMNISAWTEKFNAKTLSPVYESIISNTVDPACIPKLLNSRQCNTRTVLSIAEFNTRNEVYDPSYLAKLNERFHARKMLQLEEEPDKTVTNELSSQMMGSSNMDLSPTASESFMPFYDEIESRYELVKDSNQTKMFGLNSSLQVNGTPLKAITPLKATTSLKSSTPLRSSTPLKSKNRSVGSVKDSPLLRAFEKCKSLNESKKKKERKVWTLTEALAFLGLKDVTDIFADPLEDEEMEAEEEVVKISANPNLASECPDVDKTIVSEHKDIPSTSATNQVSQYTVSQILQIVNVSHEERDRDRPENNISNVTNKSEGKEIYIGTIDEIFGFDDNGEMDSAVPSDKQSASEEDVIASSQPVIPEIKLPSKYLNNNSRTSNHSEFAPSGDDMFASFLKGNSSVTSTSSNNSNNVLSKTTNLPLMRPAVELHRAVNATQPKTKSPSPNKSTLQVVDKSPSVFKRRVNLSRLRALSTKSNSERIPSNALQNKSPLFFSCNNFDVNHSKRNDDFPTRIHEEDSDNSSQIDETFKIHRNPNKRNRVIDDTICEAVSSKKKTSTAIFKKPKKSNQPRNHFIEDECGVSDGSSDEMDVTLDGDLNSIICNDEVHDDTSVDMRAIYLQSVKSPVRKSAYKFSNPNAYLHNTNIFSQPIIEEDESDYDTSFVVDECSEEEDDEQEMSVLERAEWLLKMRRQEKRKISNNNSSNTDFRSVPKRRKIIECSDSSDENI